MRIEVDAENLRRVLQALIGPEHHIRELQATRKLHDLVPNPLQALLDEYNLWAGSAQSTGSGDLNG
jgi:hypothetical protein